MKAPPLFVDAALFSLTICLFVRSRFWRALLGRQSFVFGELLILLICSELRKDQCFTPLIIMLRRSQNKGEEISFPSSMGGF
nr:hypothetical protein Iba_chr05cCG12130 [Ipomoea batatas]